MNNTIENMTGSGTTLWTVILRYSGKTTKLEDVDADSGIVSLMLRVKEVTGIEESKQILKAGFPPKNILVS